MMTPEPFSLHEDKPLLVAVCRSPFELALARSNVTGALLVLA
jgi:hypothetical protein